MALELRPLRVLRQDLPPAALDARICTYECTFCAQLSARLRDIPPDQR